MRRCFSPFWACALLCALPFLSFAGTVTVSGYLNDPANLYLIGSDLWADANTPPAPSFTDDYAVANNVALYLISFAAPSTVSFVTHGFLAEGIDPYFTIFSGGDGTATFLDSNYVQAFSTGGDISQTMNLAAGSYFVALGVFANMSFAENLGGGTLQDGFTGLGGPVFMGSTYYELDITDRTPGSTDTPEPGAWICGPSLGLLYLLRRRRLMQ
jgi:hypothetical protein